LDANYERRAMATTKREQGVIPEVINPFRKVKRTELPKIKEELIAKQNGNCPICGKDLTRVSKGNIVVDHDHETGIIRAALHRGCNGIDGKILKLLRTWGKATSLDEAIKTLKRLITFWELHKKAQTYLIYPSFKTEEEKREARNKKQRKKYHKMKLVSRRTNNEKI
jgi:hypothetical protein